MYDWNRTILRIDLSKGTIEKQPISKSLIKKFIGGRGLNSWTLFQEVDPGIDPLGSENVVCISSGPLTGTSLSLTSRIEVSTLSPLTGILGDGNAGGQFPVFLRRAGYDQIVITGKATSPKYIWIDNEYVELRDASNLWGQTVWETVDRLQELNGRDVRIACIGQAGENLVRFATTMNDKYSSGAPGSGAVLGSKKLKAIAVRGSGKVLLSNSADFHELAREDKHYIINDRIQRDIVKKYGSHILNLWAFPDYKYFESSFTPKTLPDRLSPESLKKFETGRYACHGCVVACKNVYTIPSGKRKGEKGVGLEFETISMLGTNCGILDPIAIMEMGNMADAYGMDSICLGNAISFAKFLYNRRIISNQETEGLDLIWEDVDAQKELIHQTALREGFGNIVAEGMHGIAKLVKRGTTEYCYHVKGFSRGVHPPGVFALAHATSTRGADHLRARSWRSGARDAQIYAKLVENGEVPQDMTQEPEKWMAIMERVPTIADSIGRCKGAVNTWICAAPLVWKYTRMFEGVARLLETATGVPFKASDIVDVADRIYLLERAFNVRQGITREDDRLLLKPEIRKSAQGEAEIRRHIEMLTEYYRVHGCDIDTGIPTRDALKRFDLKCVADELDAHGPYKPWNGPPLWPMNDYPHGGKRF